MLKNRLIQIIKEEIDDYRGEHSAPSPENGGLPMHDLEDHFPDMYSQGYKFYGYRDRNNMEAIGLIQQAENNPDMRIKIYRAVPKINSGINNGDWVTIVKDYAITHGKANLNNDYKILTKTVRAGDIYTEGNSVLEWGYYR